MTVSKHRVAFAGASGTGKSTLAKEVAARLKIPMTPVGSREVSSAMGFASPYDVDAAGKRAEFQHLLLEMKYAWERQHDEFVSDRTYVDNLAYTLMHSPEAVGPGFLNGVGSAMQLFTHVFVCPIGAFFDLANDPARVKDFAYHQQYEGLLLGRLIEHADSRTLVTLVTARERDARLSQVMRVLGA